MSEVHNRLKSLDGQPEIPFAAIVGGRPEAAPLDATVVRAFIVPAVISLPGRVNWLPRDPRRSRQLDEANA